MNTNLAPTAHHPLGPSQWPAWAECADYEGIKDIEDADIESLMPETKKPDADAKGRGTAQHEALAKALTGQPDAFAGLDETEELQVRWVAEQVVEIAAENGYQPSDLRVEQRLTLFEPGGFNPLYFGTGDVRFGPFLIDAKYGDERNYVAQLAGYALPIMEETGFGRVYCILLYGRLKRTRRFTLDKATAEAISYGLLGKRTNPNRTPTICSYCGWCSKGAVCSALNGIVDRGLLAKREDWAIRIPTMHASQAGADPVILGAMRYVWKKYIEPWGNAVEFATNAIAATNNVPLGFKKQNERGRLAIDSSLNAANALVAAGMTPDSVLGAATFSLDALGKAYKAQFGGAETAAKLKVEEIMVSAKAAARGDASFKLIRQSNAEDEIRLALARPVSELPCDEPKQVTNPTTEQVTT